MAEIKAIGEFLPDEPKKHPMDWIFCKDESPGGNLFILPHGTRVEVTSTANDRDYFKILDFNELRGKRASLSFATVGGRKVSRLIPLPAYSGPARVVWDAAAGTVTAQSGDGSRKVVAKATCQPVVPNGTYGLWPKVPEKALQYAAQYIDRAPHALSWWIIAYRTAEAYCLHTGTNSLGCVTVTEHHKWEDIYKILQWGRTADGLYSGNITIAGHDLYV